MRFCLRMYGCQILFVCVFVLRPLDEREGVCVCVCCTILFVGCVCLPSISSVFKLLSDVRVCCTFSPLLLAL